MMIKPFVAAIAICAAICFSACENNSVPNQPSVSSESQAESSNEFVEQSESPDEASNTERITYTENEMPKNSAENQKYVDKYMYPFSVTGIFRCDFSTGNMSELDIHLKSIFNAFYNYDYPDSELKLTDYETEVPEDVFEGTLMAHLDLTTEQIRKACAEYYDADKKMYTASFGLGGGPSEFIITGSSLENGILSLSYNSFGGDYDNITDEFRWLLYEHGQLQIEVNGDNYRFVSNVLIKAPGID